MHRRRHIAWVLPVLVASAICVLWLAESWGSQSSIPDRVREPKRGTREPTAPRKTIEAPYRTRTDSYEVESVATRASDRRLAELFTIIASDARDAEVARAYLALSESMADTGASSAELARVGFVWLTADSASESPRLRNVHHVFTTLADLDDHESKARRAGYCSGSSGGPNHVQLRNLFAATADPGFAKIAKRLAGLLAKSPQAAYDALLQAYQADPASGRALVVHLFDGATKQGSTIPLLAVALRCERPGDLLSLVAAIGDHHAASQAAMESGRTEASIEQHLGMALQIATSGFLAKDAISDRVTALQSLIVTRVHDHRYSITLGLAFAHCLAAMPAESRQAIDALTVLAGDPHNRATRRAARRALATRVDPETLLSAARATTGLPATADDALELIDLFRGVYKSYETRKTGKDAVVTLTRRHLSGPGTTPHTRLLQLQVLWTMPSTIAKGLRNELRALSVCADKDLATAAKAALEKAK